MRVFDVFHGLSLLSLAFCIIPEARISRNEDSHGPESRISLPNLLSVHDVSNLYNDWEVKGAMILDVGRFVLEHDSGSIWSRHLLPNSKDEWTVEVVFRASEQADVDDHTFYDSNGFSLWLLDEVSVPSDSSNFGGPKIFDGLHFLMNNKGYRGLKIFASDGHQPLPNAEEHALGGCNINYLDSTIPFNLRVSYSASRNWFKVQIDNELCFSTDKLSLKEISSDMRLGVSASTDATSKEYWEILKLNVFDFLTDDAMDDHGVAAAPVPPVVTVTEKRPRPTSNFQSRQSLMEKVMSNRPQAAALDQAKVERSLDAISSKLSVLEQNINVLDIKKISDLPYAIDGVKQMQHQQSYVLSDLKKTYGNLESMLASHYKEMTDSVRNLNQELANEVRKYRSEVQGVARKVDLLMDNHQEIKGKYQQFDDRKANSELLRSIMKWVLIPLVIGIVAVIVVIYRLKKDIKHSKLL